MFQLLPKINVSITNLITFLN